MLKLENAEWCSKVKMTSTKHPEAMFSATSTSCRAASGEPRRTIKNTASVQSDSNTNIVASDFHPKLCGLDGGQLDVPLTQINISASHK